MDVISAIPAPEFKEIRVWANSKPLLIKDLKGKIVLLDCWTYTCIFCLRTIPIMKRLQEKYAKYGFQIIQAHSAEYQFARDIQNIQNALSRYNIYKVAAIYIALIMYCINKKETSISSIFISNIMDTSSSIS